MGGRIRRAPRTRSIASTGHASRNGRRGTSALSNIRRIQGTGALRHSHEHGTRVPIQSISMAKKPPPNDVFFASAVELNQRLLAKEFSAVELIKAFCDRLETSGPTYNALAHSLRKKALAKAKQTDRDLKVDRRRGPLHGVPFAVIDLLDVAGAPCTWGAKPMAAQIPKEDARVVKKLDAAGAILTGKLSMVELAGGGGYRYAAASLQGPGLNPWDKTRWSGGSSSGPGSAVAAGLVTFAIGSETWGSILTPAAYCGVTGLRPTYGYVSRNGAMALSWTMDKIGPMARTAEDCGHILQAISGGDAEDPGSVGKSFYLAPQFQKPLSEMRIGFAPSDPDAVTDEGVRKAIQGGFDALRSLGVKMVETELPPFPYATVAGTIIGAEGASVFEPLIVSGQIDQLADQRQIIGLKAALEIPAKDYLKAMRIRSMMQQELGKLFSDIDILVTASRFGVATPIGEPLDRTVPNTATPTKRGLLDLGAAGNLAGLPALSLPCGFAGGLPVAIQLVSRPFTENTILAAGMEFQKRTDWHRRRPQGL